MAVEPQALETVARRLACENSDADADITKIIWFPSDREIRLVEVHSAIPPSGEIAPFYFPPDVRNGIPYPSAIALVNSADVGVELPEEWGPWNRGIELFKRERTDLAGKWRDAYWTQAKSDWAMYDLLSRQRAPLCHRLHYLQMATEKLSKAFRSNFQGGGRQRPVHESLAVFIRASTKHSEFWTHFRMDKRTYTHYAVHYLVPVAEKFESLYPKGVIERPNPEYPWEDNLRVFVPVEWTFSDIVTPSPSSPWMKLMDFVHWCFRLGDSLFT